MITLENAMSTAVDNGCAVSDDYKVEQKGCQPAKKAFYVRKGDQKIEVVQGATCRQWLVKGDVVTGRGAAIVEAIRILLNGAAWK